MTTPPLPTNVGKRGSMRFPPKGVQRRFTITDEIRKYQSDNRKKLFVLQRIQFDDGRLEIRLGYYIIGKMPRLKGRWVWGQYATLLPIRDFRALVRRAEKLKWI